MEREALAVEEGTEEFFFSRLPPSRFYRSPRPLRARVKNAGKKTCFAGLIEGLIYPKLEAISCIYLKKIKFKKTGKVISII